MIDSGSQKRTGRPRVPDAERKRHTLTFRMRGDLREAVKELAAANGRTMSEQIEHYVDAAIFAEAKLMLQRSTNELSPALYIHFKNLERKKGEKEFAGAFSTERCETLAAEAENVLDAHAGGAQLSNKKSDPHEVVVQMARLFLDAFMRGAVGALGQTFDPDLAAALQADPAHRDAAQNTSRTALEARCAAAEAVAIELRAKLDAQTRRAATAEEMEAEFKQYLGRPLPPGGAPDMPLSADLSAGSAIGLGTFDTQVRHTDREKDLSLTALVEIVRRTTDLTPVQEPLNAARWPQRFVELPADTRAALIGILREDAPEVYEALMRTVQRDERPEQRVLGLSRHAIFRGQTLAAIRRLQVAFLPAEGDAEAAQDDDEPGDLAPDEGATASYESNTRRRR